MSIKKIFTTAALFAFTAGLAFSSNFFAHRFFEVQLGADVGFSNNLLSCDELLQKELVIDLRKLSNECPADGLNFITLANPSAAVNFNILGVTVGLSSGIDLYEQLNFEKGFFDFLGKGSSLGEPLSFGFTNDTDVFAYSQLNVGFKLGDFMVYAKPAVFLPVFSIRNSGGVITFQNDEDGSIHAGMDLNMNIYTSFTVANDDGSTAFGTNTVEEIFAAGYGFDLAGAVRIPIGRSLSLDAEARIPMIPGQLTKRTYYTQGFTYDAESILTIVDAESESTGGEFTAGEDVTLYMHRPLKAAVYVNQDLLGTLVSLRGGAGFGIQRPFSEDFFIYPEYYLGALINLADVLKLGVSTQYRDQLFIHQLGGTVNIRLAQVDAGISVQSANFIKSCQGAGFGAYGYVTVGF